MTGRRCPRATGPPRRAAHGRHGVPRRDARRGPRARHARCGRPAAVDLLPVPRQRARRGAARRRRPLAAGPRRRPRPHRDPLRGGRADRPHPAAPLRAALLAALPGGPAHDGVAGAATGPARARPHRGQGRGRQGTGRAGRTGGSGRHGSGPRRRGRGRGAGRATAGPPLQPAALGRGRAVAALLGGYLLVAAAAVLYVSSGVVRVEPMSAVLNLPLVAGLAVAAGVWAAGSPGGTPLVVARRMLAVVPRRARRRSAALWPDAARGRPHRPHRPRPAAVLRAAAAGTAFLLGGGALLLTGSLAVHAAAVQQSLLEVTVAWSGRVAVILLCVALLPNAVVWAAAYGLGPGFAVGAGGAVAPLGVAAYPHLTSLPLFAALPASGAPGPFALAALAALPAAAGVAVARAAVPRHPGALDRSTAVGTAATAALAALLCGAVFTCLSYVASGAVGRAALATFGPVWWAVGAAALAWTLGIGVPGALVLRWRRRAVREAQRPKRDPGTVPDWCQGPVAALGMAPLRPTVGRRPEPAAEEPRPGRRWWTGVPALRAVAAWLGFRARPEAVAGSSGAEVAVCGAGPRAVVVPGVGGRPGAPRKVEELPVRPSPERSGRRRPAEFDAAAPPAGRGRGRSRGRPGAPAAPQAPGSGGADRRRRSRGWAWWRAAPKKGRGRHAAPPKESAAPAAASP
ncbi:DUF6350 family protein [Streptomyces stramineus]